MGWSPELYLDEAMIEAEKLNLKQNQTFEHGIMQNIFILIV